MYSGTHGTRGRGEIGEQMEMEGGKRERERERKKLRREGKR